LQHINGKTLVNANLSTNMFQTVKGGRCVMFSVLLSCCINPER